MGVSKAKPLFWLAGWLSSALGVLGIFLPLLPTTIFFIMAAWCWSHSHPHLAEKIFQHPRFGTGVRHFLQHGQISGRGKCFASGGIAVGFVVFLLTMDPGLTVSLVVAGVLSTVVIWLVTRPIPKSARKA